MSSGFLTSGSLLAVAAASADARLTDRPSAPAGNSDAKARTERRSWAMCSPPAENHVTQTCNPLANEKTAERRRSVGQHAGATAAVQPIGIDPHAMQIAVERRLWRGGFDGKADGAQHGDGALFARIDEVLESRELVQHLVA